MKAKYVFTLHVYIGFGLASFIEIKGKILEGVFERRLTRFSVLVNVDGEALPCFLPNPGRLRELLASKVRVVLKESAARKGERKTVYDVIGVYSDDAVVSVDSRFSNKLVFETLKGGDLPEFRGYDAVKPEYSHGRARFDFLLYGRRAVKPCLLEVKSCTLVRKGVAMFPDPHRKRR